MDCTTVFRRGFLSFVLIALAVATGHGAASIWEAEAFVILGEPELQPTTAEQAENLGKDAESIDSEVAERREADLDQIASEYRARGLRAPMLDPIGTRPDGSKVYEVFLFGFAGSLMDPFSDLGGAYEAVPQQIKSKGCKPITSGWLALNADKSPGREGFYLTLAHELFHGVQAAYPFKRGCMMADWINEGMAKAVEQVMYEDKTGREWGVRRGNRGSQGLRPYHVPLHYERALKRPGEGGALEMATFPYEVTGFMTITRTQIGYGTASFWRFLVEAGGGLEVLDPMMSMVITDDSAEGRLAWVEDALGKADAHFNGDRLYALYPEFVTEFASWGGTRYKKIAIKDSGSVEDSVGNFGNNLDAARDQWLKLAFNGCSEIEVSPGESEKVTLELERVASRCIRVSYVDVRVPTTPVVEAVHDESGTLDGLHLGVAWESSPDREHNCWKKGETYRPGTPRCLLKTRHLESSEGHWAREWIEGPVSPTGTGTLIDQGRSEKLYVLSNVRKKEPWKTTIVEDLTFRVGLPATELASGEDAGPPEGRALKADESMERLAERAQGGEVSRTETMEAASEMMARVMSGMTPEAAYGAQGGIGLPVAPTELGSFSFERVDGRLVTLQPMPDRDGDKNELGETGPLLGAVMLETDGMALESSMLCESNEGRAGRVVESNEDRLVIEIAADICRMDPSQPMTCADGCPTVDRIEATLKLPAGWRYYSRSAPEPVVTPGIEDYIRRFVDMDAPAFVGSPSGPDEGPPAEAGDAGPDGGDATGTVREPVEAGPNEGEGDEADEFECACTCEEFGDLNELIEEATQMMLPRTEGLERVHACMARCFEEYAACQ